MLGSDGVFDVLSDQARVQCVGPETSQRNVLQEVADIIWRAMAGDGKDAVRWGAVYHGIQGGKFRALQLEGCQRSGEYCTSKRQSSGAQLMPI